MPSDLSAKIIGDIKKTGYPTELRASRLIQETGWFIEQNPSYLDENDHTSREYDIYAYRGDWGSKGSIHLGNYLLIECKREDKPWVFFRNVAGRSLDRPEYIKTSNLEILFGEKALLPYTEINSIFHYFDESIPLCSSYYVAMSGAQERQTIFKAIMSCMNATNFYTLKAPLRNSALIGIYFPLIVFEGELLCADIDNNVSVQPTQHLLLHLNYARRPERTRAYPSEYFQRYFIDVINIDYLQDYLHIVASEMSRLFEALNGNKAI